MWREATSCKLQAASEERSALGFEPRRQGGTEEHRERVSHRGKEKRRDLVIWRCRDLMVSGWRNDEGVNSEW